MDRLEIAPDRVIALGLPEAVEMLCALPDPGPALHKLLDYSENSENSETSAISGSLIVASVLARSRVLPNLEAIIVRLIQQFMQRIGMPREPAARNILRRALESVQQRWASALEEDHASVSARTLAGLTRVRAGLASNAGEFEEARALFTAAIEAYEALGDRDGTATASIEMALLLWHSVQDLAGSTDYLAQAADILLGGPAHDELAVLERALVNQLIEKATALHYEVRDYELAIRLARRATRLAPDQAAAWLILGNALSFLEKYDSAIEAYQHLIKLDPEEKSSARTNLAAALLALDRPEEALQAVNDSLRLRPGEVRPLVMRGQLRARAGDQAGAIADLEAVISLLEASRPQKNLDDADATRHYREHWRMWYTAYHNLLNIHEQGGNRAAIDSILARLVATGDDALTALGYRKAGDLARHDGRLADARNAYDAALGAFESDTESRLSRAQTAAGMGDIDGALADLAWLTPRDRAPREALQGLKAVAGHFPQEPRIQRWLGFANIELGAFDEAEQSLRAYLEYQPEDAEAQRWLGLSLISVDRSKYDAKKDGARCFRGLETLARAMTAGDAEARDALLWVIDRLLLGFGFAQFFLASSRPVLVALPALNGLLKSLATANDHALEYAARVAALHECIGVCSTHRLPCFATYLHAMLADIELLQGHAQQALQHIQTASGLESIVFTPRSKNLHQYYERTMDREHGDAAIEIEHFHIYERTNEALKITRLTAARIQAAAGDQGQAVDLLGDFKAILSYVDGIPVTEACVVAQTLRDAGRFDNALAVLDRAAHNLEAHSSNEERGNVLSTRSTILASRGDLAEAIEAAAEAVALVQKSRAWVVWMNLASSLDAAGLPAEALKILDQIEIDQVARSHQDTFGYFLLQASALHKSQHSQKAQKAANAAIAVLETLRGELKDLTLRTSLARRTEHAYALAIHIAADCDDMRTAFDLTEKSRSRLLVDEMAIGRRMKDEVGIRIEQQIRDAEEQHELLASLTETATLSSRTGALVRLRKLDPGLDIMHIDKNGSVTISEQKLTHYRLRVESSLGRLRQELGAYRLKSAESLFGEVIDYEGCTRLLAGLQ